MESARERVKVVGEGYTLIFCKEVAKWSDLEAEVKNWTTDHKNYGMSVSTKNYN
jgi:hypothetical protein